MEAEYNRLQYNLATTTTVITVPYMTTSLEQLPLTFTTNTAGVGTGNIRFSSIVAPTRSTGYDNLTYKPSDVTNMGAGPSGITNNSAKTIDRFWLIDANNYTTKPAVTLSFTYLDNEWATNGGNSITEANLRAQRFNSTINDWGGYVDYMPSGAINTTSNTVSSVTVTASNFFKSWTLNDKSIPLPIELLNFDATCLGNQILLNWCTASEKNNSFFTIEHSTNGISFYNAGKVLGNGTTTSKQCYNYSVTYDNEINYFKLLQTDDNGKTSTSSIITTNNCNEHLNSIFISNNGTKSANLILNSNIEENIQVYLHNSLGQIISVKEVAIINGTNKINLEFDQLSNSVYYLSVYKLNELVYNEKIIISDATK
jgi:hypothetical protein